MRNGKRVLIFVTILAGLLTAGRANAQSDTEYRLENGLRVHLRPLRSALNVALVVLFDVGSDHDPEGQSGLAHLVEHLYVTAATGESPSRTVGDIMTRYAGGWNAQTGTDYTVVANVFPRAALVQEIRDAAARMGDLRIEVTDLARETPRMREEVGNMFGEFPVLAALNRARERVRPGPAGSRCGGVPEQIAALDRATVVARWQTAYRPGNARLVLAGGFELDEARRLLDQAFGGLPVGDAPTRRPVQRAPADLAEIELAAVAPPGSRSEACLGYSAPRPGDPTYAAFLALAARLFSRAPHITSEPGRFPVQYAPLDAPDTLTIGVPLLPTESPAAAVARVDAFVAETVGAPLSDADRTNVLQALGFLLGLVEPAEFALAQNPYGAAFAPGRRAQLGLEPARLREQIAHLTDADLRAAVAAHFARERRGAVVVTPR